jgi:hypothetical protein
MVRPRLALPVHRDRDRLAQGAEPALAEHAGGGLGNRGEDAADLAVSPRGFSST